MERRRSHEGSPGGGALGELASWEPREERASRRRRAGTTVSSSAESDLAAFAVREMLFPPLYSQSNDVRRGRCRLNEIMYGKHRAL